jgi:ATP-dependent Lhr-like helicase
VAQLLAHPPSSTERLHARTLLFLERHGVLSREAMNLETQLGRFGAIYPVLREMEERGRIRRGNFVEGMTSAQFAVPGAVDRLRALRGPSERPDAVLLAALDPAQPYGSQLEWPQTRLKQGRPRRAVGAGVVLVDGTPCLFIDGGGQRVLSFDTPLENSGSERLDAALRILAAGAARLGLKRIQVEEIDGEKARSSALAGAFVSAGFRVGYRGFEVDRLPGPADHAAVDSSLDADATSRQDSGAARQGDE